jgi:signal transduction histidine kinase
MRYPSERDPRSVLGEIGNIGGELEATVTALLQLARIESGVQAAQHEPVDVQALLTRVLARHNDALHARGLRVERTDAQQTVRIESDPALLEIVLDNLLGNAIAYAPAGSEIGARVAPQRVEIANAAPELNDEDLARFGRRFWRKRAGEDGTGHAGLGLALAQAAARALEMRLEFALSAGGLTAILAW